MASKNDKPVGYGKPPVHSRFKPGQSGNPKGRPRGSLNFATDLKATLRAPVSLTEGGKSRRVSSQQATLFRLRQKALAGGDRAIDKYLSLAAALDAKTAGTESTALAADDHAILERYKQEILATANAAPPTSNKDGDDT